MSLARKMRKLARNPRDFVRDARVVKIVRRLLDLAEQTDTTAEPALVHGVSLGPYVLAATVTASELRVADTPPAAKGWASLLFVPPDLSAQLPGLLAAIGSMPSNTAFLPRNLMIAESQGICSIPPSTFLDTIPMAEKERLGRFQNVVFLGDHGSLPAALRAADPSLRIVQVAEGSLPAGCTPWETDVLLFIGEASALLPAAWRRVLVAKDRRFLAAALGRALQEAGPKPLELLLPAWGDIPYDPSLLDVSTERLDGLLLLRRRSAGAPRPIAPRDFGSWLEGDIAPRLVGVLLAERTMWRYRSLVDAATEPLEWARLLGVMLHDGARLEVRQVVEGDKMAEDGCAALRPLPNLHDKSMQ